MSWSLAVATLAVTTLAGEEAPRFSSQNLPWRSIGPSVVGGRIVDLAVDPTRPSRFFVASASGGLFGTQDHGTTFTPLLDEQECLCLGAVAVAPSDPDVLWVGTGEANPRNSVSWGKGVLRSTDAGKTWTHCGLEDSRAIGAIAIHPTDPQVVFVAAMGHTWGPNPVRGLYRTRNGGESFERVLAVDDHTGCIDVLIDPRDPRVVLAATWQRQRDEFDDGDPAIQTGPGSGLWRSQDGGDHFERVQDGLPSRELGRIGLDRCSSQPDVVYAVVQTDLTGSVAPDEGEGNGRAHLGVRGEETEAGYRLSEVIEGRAGAAADLHVGDLLLGIGDLAVNDSASLRAALEPHKPGDEAVLHLERDGERIERTVTFGALPKIDRGFGTGMQGGQSANSSTMQGSFGHETGGVFRSDDGGRHWERVNSLDPRPFYYSQIRVDPSDPDRVFVLGIQLHRSLDGGRTFEAVASGPGLHSDHHALWIDPRDGTHLLLGNDGGLFESFDRGESFHFFGNLPIAQFYAAAVDDRDPYTVYGGLQDNGTWGGPSAAPGRGSGVTALEWFRLAGGDGFRCAVDPRNPDLVLVESQNGGLLRRDRRTGNLARVPMPDGRFRFHWNTPFFLSPHDPDQLYVGANALIRVQELRRANVVSEGISLPRTDRGTASAITESPRVPGLLYFGTDDGHLWRLEEDGARCARISDALPGLEGRFLAMADLEASRYADGRLYVAVDGHRSDDVRPHLFVSEDFGYTFTTLDAGLPENGSVRCVTEDPRQEDLLYVGTEFGCFVSVDRGVHWERLGHGMPPVAVHDLVVQNSARELVAATHGRGMYLLDVHPLQRFEPGLLTKKVHLFPPRPAVSWSAMPAGIEYAHSTFTADQPEVGAVLHYWLAESAGESVTLRVTDLRGRPVATLSGSGEAGLQRAVWNLGGLGSKSHPGRVTPGAYKVELRVAGESASTVVSVLPEPVPVFDLQGLGEGR